MSGVTKHRKKVKEQQQVEDGKNQVEFQEKQQYPFQKSSSTSSSFSSVGLTTILVIIFVITIGTVYLLVQYGVLDIGLDENQFNLKRQQRSRIQQAGLNSDLENFSLLPSASTSEARIAIMCSHHRTGTQFIAQVSQETSKAFGYNYQMVDVAMDLKNGSRSSILFYFSQTSLRIIGAMHGFLETCGDHNVTLQDERVFQVHDCLLDDIECNLEACHIKMPPKNTDIRVAHFIRNPVEVLISSYLYHAQDVVAEEWLQLPKPEVIPEEIREEYQHTPYYKFLQQADSIHGLKSEFLRIVNELYQMARNTRDISLLEGGLNVKFEDLGHDYFKFNEEVFFHLGLIRPDIMWKHYIRLWKIFDIGAAKNSKVTKQEDVQAHITEGRYDKQALRQVLFDNMDTRQLLTKLAQSMGYQQPFKNINFDATQ
eukprot:TRINITY_DN2007_c0_g1_i3.p1 TRINITY_DN2007_c0_g1~~TRINITY_DN2007_c0_g1_i3.p1  ORF type:complete len:476 (+),score=52.34 TRINITY_DN2007_c0_g1_i3:153-1430(+)